MSLQLIDPSNIYSTDYHIIDVRTPAEFTQGHIPQAINIPLFTDQERAEVGTIYKQRSPQKAFDRGLEIVGPKMITFVQHARKLLPSKPLLIYCWRGGMRSESMGWLLTQAGFSVYKLTGGYKAFRHFIRQEFTRSANITILSGKTGVGKTRYLHQLKAAGEQILDLEALANHMGSSFGYRGDNIQPSNEAFENSIYQQWRSFDLSRTIWIEDESQKVGQVSIPDPLYQQMLSARVIEISVGQEQRIKNILEDYQDIKQDVLIQACNYIKKRLGGLRHKQATKFISEGDYASAVPILLEYYDTLYERYAKKHPRPTTKVHDPSIELLIATNSK